VYPQELTTEYSAMQKFMDCSAVMAFKTRTNIYLSSESTKGWQYT